MQKLMRDGKLAGVVGTEGDLWREQRKFTLHVLRNLGMGKAIIEETIMLEVNRLLTVAQEEIEQGVKEHDLAHIIEVCVGSIINRLLFGYRFEGETTTSTTNFGILYLMAHPEVQKKMQKEIDSVVGSEKQVSLNDRPKLPYTNAVCNVTSGNLKPVNLEKIRGFTVQPSPFKCHLERRIPKIVE
uniref:Cytochrome P450 n=1 Tax=Acrobeloides nanus TaxID=290746 RepID=A0A914CHT4_9BILA